MIIYYYDDDAPYTKNMSPNFIISTHEFRMPCWQSSDYFYIFWYFFWQLPNYSENNHEVNGDL